MNKELCFPWDADKVSILTTTPTGDFKVLAVLTRPDTNGISVEDRKRAWIETIEVIRRQYAYLIQYGDIQVWARDDAPDILNAEEVTGEDIAHLERVKMSPEPMVRNPHPVEFPKADPKFIEHVRRGLSRKRA